MARKSPVTNRFGCRIEGVMSPQPSAANIQHEKNQTLGAILYSDENSLYKESLKRSPKDGKTQLFGLEDFAGWGRQGQPNGWGIAEYPSRREYTPPIVVKKPACAGTDPVFPIAVNHILSNSPNILLAHIRQATPGFRLFQPENTHPFSYQHWSQVHNGTIPGALSPQVSAKINQFRPFLGGGPKGDTDSERAFYYYLARLQETTGSLNPQKIPLEIKQRVFAQSLKELVAYSHPTFQPLKSDVMGVGGHIMTEPACNIIISDGKIIMGFRKVNDLFLGEKKLSNGQTMYMLSSERMLHNDPTVKWASVPTDHIVTISHDKSGNPTATFEPILELLQAQRE